MYLHKSASIPKPPKDPKDMSVEEIKKYTDDLRDHLNKSGEERNKRIQIQKKKLDDAIDEYNKTIERVNKRDHDYMSMLDDKGIETPNTLKKNNTLRPIIGAGLVGLGGYALYRHLKKKNDKKG